MTISPTCRRLPIFGSSPRRRSCVHAGEPLPARRADRLVVSYLCIPCRWARHQSCYAGRRRRHQLPFSQHRLSCAAWVETSPTEAVCPSRRPEISRATDRAAGGIRCHHHLRVSADDYPSSSKVHPARSGCSHQNERLASRTSIGWARSPLWATASERVRVQGLHQ